MCTTKNDDVCAKEHHSEWETMIPAVEYVRAEELAWILHSIWRRTPHPLLILEASEHCRLLPVAQPIPEHVTETFRVYILQHRDELPVFVRISVSIFRFIALGKHFDGLGGEGRLQRGLITGHHDYAT